MKGVQAAVLGGSALVLLILALRLTLKDHLPRPPGAYATQARTLLRSPAAAGSSFPVSHAHDSNLPSPLQLSWYEM